MCRSLVGECPIEQMKFAATETLCDGKLESGRTPSVEQRREVLHGGRIECLLTAAARKSEWSEVRACGGWWAPQSTSHFGGDLGGSAAWLWTVQTLLCHSCKWSVRHCKEAAFC
jgi:hypothetical protein